MLAVVDLEIYTIINGLFDCHRSNAPVLAIAAHIPSLEIGGNYFQETHPQHLFKECSCFCELVSSADQMPRMLSIAIQTAISKRGVAVLVISGDVAQQKLADNTKMFRPREPKPIVLPNPDELKQMAAILNKSKKITLFCGHGCAGAHSELMQLCEKLKSPMVHALRGKEHVEFDNPFDVGMTGFIGFSSGYYAIQDCEALLMLGTNFPYRQFYPANAHVIQVDIRGENIGRRCPVEVGVVGNVKDTIQALLPYLTAHNDSSFLDKAVKHYKKAR